MHGIDNTGLYNLEISSAADKFMMVLRIGITVSIPLYIMLTGFLNNKKTLSRRYYLGYVRIYLIYLLCCIPTLLLEYFYKHSLTSVKEMLGAVSNFSANGYAWYLCMYTGLFLMIPFLNMMYHGCKNKRQKQVLVFSFFALTILPSFTNILVHFYSSWWWYAYPICYYFTGAYLSEYMPKVKPLKLFAVLVGFLAAESICFYVYNEHSAGQLTNVYQTSWQVYVMAVMTFVLVYNLNLERIPDKLAKLVMKISDLTLTIYLLTWIPDGLSYPIMVQIAPDYRQRYIWLLVTVPFAFISATLMALVVDKIFQPLYSFIMGKLNKLVPN
jgi:surface polysaccharide O-acyltransferase-like enzyme